VSDGERAYLSSDWRISAYRLVDGHLLWQTKQQEAHKGYYLYLRDKFLFEYESPPRPQQVIHKFDPASGVEIDKRIVPVAEGASYLCSALEQVDLLCDNTSLQVVDPSSNRALGHIPRDVYELIFAPVVTSDLLVMTIGRVTMKLLVLKLDTGEVLWQELGLVSNAVVIGNTVYAIATDGSARAYDLSNGHEIGRVELEPATTEAETFAYTLVADPARDMIYAYYEDSQELVALGR
jgi:hypothetical protein